MSIREGGGVIKIRERRAISYNNKLVYIPN
jgi:hypothetical protein